jgi:hypothetical protein
MVRETTATHSMGILFPFPWSSGRRTIGFVRPTRMTLPPSTGNMCTVTVVDSRVGRWRSPPEDHIGRVIAGAARAVRCGRTSTARRCSAVTGGCGDNSDNRPVSKNPDVDTGASAAGDVVMPQGRRQWEHRNTLRPHQAFGYLTPAEFLALHPGCDPG